MEEEDSDAQAPPSGSASRRGLLIALPAKMPRPPNWNAPLVVAEDSTCRSVASPVRLKIMQLQASDDGLVWSPTRGIFFELVVEACP